jgi:WD40 repeat protein
MNLPLRAIPFCVMAALVLAPVLSAAQTNQAQPVKVVPNVGTAAFGNAAISPDGRQIAATDVSPDVQLWDVATARLMQTIQGHKAMVMAVTFSPDGKRVLSGSRDKSVKLWDLATGQTIRTFEGHSDIINAVAFSADGNRILSASDDKTIKLWDVATGQLLRTFTGHAGKVSSVAFSPDGSRVLSGSDDHTGRLWDVATGQLLRTFAAFKASDTNSATAVAFLPDGARVVLGGDRVTLWDAASGELLRTFEPKIPAGLQRSFGAAAALVVSPDGNRIVARIRLTRTVGANERCWSVVYCPRAGSHVFADAAVIAWDVPTGRQLRIRVGTLGSRAAVSNDGARVLVDSQLEDTLTGQVIKKFQHHKLLPDAA